MKKDKIHYLKYFMTENIVCCDKATDILKLCKIMAKKNISCVIISDKDKPRGIITERDIIRKIVSKGKNPRMTKAELVMSCPIFCLDEKMDLLEAYKFMRKRNIRRVVVVNDKRVVKGIITQTDAINGLYKVLIGKVRELRLVYNRTQKLFKDSVKALFQALDAKDHYTGTHSQGVAKLAESIAAEMDLPKKIKRDIYLAGLFHDIGKIQVSDKVLNKPGKLEPEEYAQMKVHPSVSEAILRPIAEFKDLLGIIRSHHERFDGQGYPDGKKGEEIPLGARIISIADSFNAMRTNRPYRGCLSKEAAINNIVEASGKQFDPQVVEAFLKVVKRKLNL